MAVKFDAPTAQRSSETWLASPFDIDVIEALRARHEPLDPDAIKAMADSISEKGQLVPIKCRKINATNRLALVDGETRLLALRQLHDLDKTVKVRFTVATDINDDEAFEQSVLANHVRNEFTLIDYAYAIRRFLDRGWNMAKVARFFGWPNQSKVERISRLTGLPTEVQRQVAAGTIALDTALDMLSLPETEAKAIIQEAVEQAELKENHPEIQEPLDQFQEPTGAISDPPAGETPIKKRGRPKGSKKGEARAKKTAVKRAVSQKVKEAVQKQGKQTPRSLAELKAVLKDRVDAVSESLRAYLAGDVRMGDKELSKVLSIHDLEDRARRAKTGQASASMISP